MAATDILLDDDLDITISDSGDFKVTESDYQSSVLVLNTYLGAWKQHPLCGMGIVRYKGSSGQQLQIRREISVQLQADGYKINSVIVKDFDNLYYDIERINL
jgi:hypothetical protein